MTRVFLDTEFTELSRRGSLISVGLAAENGSVFYAELTDFDAETMHEWVKTTVVPLLSGSRIRSAVGIKTEEVMLCRGDQTDVSRAMRNWFQQFGGAASVQIWADVLAFDWVFFCELFGGAFGLPEQVFYIPFDLATLLLTKGIDPDATREMLGAVDFLHPKLTLGKHHALYDALLEMSIFQKLEKP